jgi:cytochrome b561
MVTELVFCAFVKGVRVEHRSVDRYGVVAQALHWFTAIVVLVAFFYGPGGSEQRVYAAARDFERQLHETLGMCVLSLLALRLLWRTFDRRPEPPQVARWMGLAARLVQAGLYLLLFAVPLTAITGAWLEGHPLTLLAGIEIPPPLALAHATGATIANLHTWLGDAILWIAGLHAAAGIYHHFVLRDGVLASMLPRWFSLRRPGER